MKLNILIILVILYEGFNGNNGFFSVGTIILWFISLLDI